MAISNPIMLLSSPDRPIATTNMPSSSPLPSPSDIFKRKASVVPPGSRAGAVLSGSFTSFTPASALLRDPQLDAPAQIRSFSALAGPDTVSSVSGDLHDQSFNNNANVNGSTISAKAKVAKEKAPRKRASKIVVKDGEEAPTKSKAVRKVSTKKVVQDQKEHGIDAPARKVGSRKANAKDNDIPVEAPETTTKKSRKSRVTNCKSEENPVTERGDGKEAVKSSTKRKSKGEAKPKAVRKPRAKKPIDTSQGLISVENITKPSALADAGTSHSAIGTAKDDIDINLVQAVKRKLDWTPPAPVANPVATSPATRLVLDPILDDSVATTANKLTNFKDLFANFAFVDDNASTTSTRSFTKSEEQAIIRKRKLIELMKKSCAEDVTSPTKKPAKKKATTITSRATAAYVDINDNDAPLMQYFSAQSAQIETNSNMAPPTKKRNKGPAKGSKQAPILLSPESAMKQVANQDFVFGTSSQLAREDSPTLLRDLHEAIQASLGSFDPITSDDDRLLEQRQRRLWSAAARTEEGILTSSPERNSVSFKETRLSGDAAFIDIDQLVAKLDCHQSRAELNSQRPVKEVAVQVQPEEELPPPSAQREPTTRPAAEDTSESAIKPSESGISAMSSAVPSGPKTKTVAKRASTKPRTASVPGLKMPNFETFTSTRLAKEIASYHFKPVKSRDAMVKLLETCWKAKHQAALQALDPNSALASPKKTISSANTRISPSKTKILRQEANTSAPKTSDVSDAPAATPTKRPRGRPKKDLTLSSSSPTFEKKPKSPTKVLKKTSTSKKKREKQDSQEEINDSDVQLTPSPPRRKPSQASKPPLPLELSVDLETSPELTSSQQQVELFLHITKAVKSAPRATDSKNPSWHEKILLYDPIILEDLAVWLNTGNLGRVGYDGEVAPTEVKKWCESKSICCLWKENLRGGNRSRY